MTRDSDEQAASCACWVWIAVIGLIVAAAALRVWRLDSIPPGLHGDEALTGIEARRILREGWVGPYAASTLGWPAGHLYWAAGVVKLLGESIFSVRFSMALCGIAAVPLTYTTIRELLGWRAGLVASYLMALSVWSLHYSRTGFNVAPWLPLELVAISLLFSAMRGPKWLFIPLGAVLGLGVYSYALFPWSAALLGIFAWGWLALDPHVRKRENVFGLVVSALVALCVAAPMIAFAVDPSKGFFQKYRRYHDLSIFRSQEFAAAGPTGQAWRIAESLATFAVAVFCHGQPDYVDGSGLTPMVDPGTALACVAGIVLAWRRRRSPEHAFLLYFLVALPLPAAFNTEGHYRGSFGVLPVLCALAALPAVQLWEVCRPRSRRTAGARGLALLALGGFVAWWNLHAYFGVLAPSGHARWVYAADFRAAVEFVRALPERPKVYFFSARWSWNYEPRRFLAPDLAGEDRSREFGTPSLDVRADEPSVFILMPPYVSLLPEIERRYPNGLARSIRAPQGDLRFVAYLVPRKPRDVAFPKRNHSGTKLIWTGDG